MGKGKMTLLFDRLRERAPQQGRLLPTPEFLRSIFDYDPETGILRWKRRDDVPKEWNTKFAGKIAGTPHSEGYVSIRIHRRQFYAHRVIIAMMTGEWPEGDGEHIDLDRSNNKWVNLRPGTRSQNMANGSLRSDNTSGFKGVYFHKSAGKYAASIQVNKKSIHLGLRDTKEEAAALYAEAAKEHFGEFARLS
jgi:HNH endonuclease